MRSQWVDVSLDMYDYLEARVEALAEENKNLKLKLEFLKKLDEDIEDAVDSKEYPLPSMLVC